MVGQFSMPIYKRLSKKIPTKQAVKKKLNPKAEPFKTWRGYISDPKPFKPLRLTTPKEFEKLLSEMDSAISDFKRMSKYAKKILSENPEFKASVKSFESLADSFVKNLKSHDLYNELKKKTKK